MTTEQYFKDKIDWKFYNALLDRAVKYEDMGIYCAIRIYAYRHNTKSRLLVLEYTNYKMRYSDASAHIIAVYMRGKHDIIYNIKLDHKKIDTKKYTDEIMSEFNSEKYGFGKMRNGHQSIDYYKLAPNNQ